MDRDRVSGLLRPIVSSFFFFSFSLFVGGFYSFLALLIREGTGKKGEKIKRKKDRLRAHVCVYLRCGGWDEMR